MVEVFTRILRIELPDSLQCDESGEEWCFPSLSSPMVRSLPADYSAYARGTTSVRGQGAGRNGDRRRLPVCRQYPCRLALAQHLHRAGGRLSQGRHPAGRRRRLDQGVSPVADRAERQDQTGRPGGNRTGRCASQAVLRHSQACISLLQRHRPHVLEWRKDSIFGARGGPYTHFIPNAVRQYVGGGLPMPGCPPVGAAR